MGGGVPKLLGFVSRYNYIVIQVIITVSNLFYLSNIMCVFFTLIYQMREIIIIIKIIKLEL